MTHHCLYCSTKLDKLPANTTSANEPPRYRCPKCHTYWAYVPARFAADTDAWCALNPPDPHALEATHG